MKPSKNLRDRLAGQSGLPTAGGSLGGGGGGNGGRSDGGLNKLIEAERLKRRDAAAGVETPDATRNKPNASVPSRLPGPKAGTGSAKSANKSTTNQGLR